LGEVEGAHQNMAMMGSLSLIHHYSTLVFFGFSHKNVNKSDDILRVKKL